MRSTRCVSSNRCSYHWSSIFPSRPELTTVIASHLAVGVQFPGCTLRHLSAASTHATDYRYASVMLQHRKSLVSSQQVLHARHDRPIRADSLSIKLELTAVTASAFSREWLRIFGRVRIGGWALGTSDRGGQDKSRKVRSVGCVRNSAKSGLLANIASVSCNLGFSRTRYRRSTFNTLQRIYER